MPDEDKSWSFFEVVLTFDFYKAKTCRNSSICFAVQIGGCTSINRIETLLSKSVAPLRTSSHFLHLFKISGKGELNSSTNQFRI